MKQAAILELFSPTTPTQESPRSSVFAAFQAHGVITAERLVRSSATLLQTPWAGSLKPGRLVEISSSPGMGKVEALLAAFQGLPRLGEIDLAWAEESSESVPCPWAFTQQGFDLSRLLWVSWPKDYSVSEQIRIFVQIIESKAFQGVVFYLKHCIREQELSILLRRVQIATERAGVFSFLLTDAPLPLQTAWPLHQSVAVYRDVWSGRIQCEVFRGKGQYIEQRRRKGWNAFRDV